VAHTFLLESGRWSLQGTWLERDSAPVQIKGGILVGWDNQGSWFTMVTKLVFLGGVHSDISFQYRGRLDVGERRYTFVLQHSELGRVEGEGWIAPESIVQRYWVLGDRQRRSGFETLHRLNDDQYYLSSGIMSRDLISTMEASLERQSD